MFLMLDKSQDGVLSVEEIRDGLDTLLGKLSCDKKEYMELIKRMDQDGNGVIDYAEFITAAIDKVAVLNQDNLRLAFEMFDKDNSGMITIDEL